MGFLSSTDKLCVKIAGMSNENMETGQYKVDRTRQQATCAVLMSNISYEGEVSCVGLRLSCKECPLGIRYTKDRSIPAAELSVLRAKAAAKVAKIK